MHKTALCICLSGSLVILLYLSWGTDRLAPVSRLRFAWSVSKRCSRYVNALGNYSCANITVSLSTPPPIPKPRGVLPTIIHSINQSLSCVHEDVTVVTAYFEIEPFGKGTSTSIRRPSEYKRWMLAWGKVVSTVVAYFDNEDNYKSFLSIRSFLPSNLTIAVMITRSDLWSWRLKPDIENIFRSGKLNKHWPNTVVPDYACAVSSKYAVMNMAVKSNPFKTNYFMWLDMGYLRHHVSDTKSFGFCLPRVEPNRVYYGEAYHSYNSQLTPMSIYNNNTDWLAGGGFFADLNTMARWCQDYRTAAEYFLHLGLAGADQQTVYSLVNTGLSNVTITTLKYVEWFSIGETCRTLWLEKYGQI